jgi:hypothetical protein
MKHWEQMRDEGLRLHPRLNDITDFDDRALYRTAFKDGANWERERSNKLVDALEFYASPWGNHHGFNDATNEVINRVLNEKTDVAKKALQEYGGGE